MSQSSISTTETFRASLKAARQASTPLVMIRTADPASAISHVTAMLNGKVAETPLLTLDVCAGLSARNDIGQVAMANVLNGADNIASIPDGLQRLAKIDADSVVFFFNPHLVWNNAPDIIQAIWNLRDVFKVGGQMLVLLTTLGAMLPSELQNDVTVVDEPLPTVSDLEALIKHCFKSADLKEPDAVTRTKIVDALIGLASFPAEQVLAMSLSKNGVNIEKLWERKAQAIEQTRGLKVWRGKEKFSDVKGCDALVDYMTLMMNGQEPARLVVLLDEANDAMAGHETDSSGTKGDMVGTLLSHMNDNNSDGVLLIGPPGTGKTMIGKATASVADRIMVTFDLAGMQSGIVGSSGENMRSALAIVDAMSQGRTMWIATCNNTSNIPPQMMRRFKDGSFYVDLPDDSGCEALWSKYEKQYNVSGPRPAHTGWTGAEIENCCRKAWRLKMTLLESAKFIVPVCRSAADKIASLRRASSGNYLSASKPGVYMYNESSSKPTVVPAKAGQRKISTE